MQSEQKLCLDTFFQPQRIFSDSSFLTPPFLYVFSPILYGLHQFYTFFLPYFFEDRRNVPQKIGRLLNIFVRTKLNYKHRTHESTALNNLWFEEKIHTPVDDPYPDEAIDRVSVVTVESAVVDILLDLAFLISPLVARYEFVYPV